MPLIALIISAAAICAAKAASESSRPRPVENRHIFNPRMDYDEWTPLGRGDPLKNDPTYDYVPPVLERVHYWMDPSKRTPDPPLPNSGVVTTSSKIEPPTTTPVASSRFDTMSLLDPFLKFMDASKATLGYSTPSNIVHYRPSPSPGFHQDVHSTQYIPPHPPKMAQRPPYTVLVPPPIPPSTETIMMSFATSTTSTTAEPESVLLTLNSTFVDATEVNTVTSATTDMPSTTNLANAENLYKPVAINMPEAISNETDREELFSRPDSMKLPLSTTFQGGTNHIQNNDVHTPSMIMVPPPRSSDDFYGFRPTTIRTTTAFNALTTDPIFKHYKQPSEPIRGPFYLIIQGHSKVKKYGASKNKVKPVSSNEINFEDGRHREDDDLASSESYRRGRKLGLKDADYTLDDENIEVVQGHPVIELSASYTHNGPVSFSISDEQESLEEAFPPSVGGSSKKRVLHGDNTNITLNRRRRRHVSRRLLATRDEMKDEEVDKSQLGLESLIALNEDYNSEDVIKLLLKEEGDGSGFGDFVSSVFGRSQKEGREI